MVTYKSDADFRGRDKDGNTIEVVRTGPRAFCFLNGEPSFVGGKVVLFQNPAVDYFTTRAEIWFQGETYSLDAC